MKGRPETQNYTSIRSVTKGILKTEYGPFSLYCFSIANEFENGSAAEHLALVYGDEKELAGPVHYRLNSACITSEAFHCMRCDCKWQLDTAMELIARQGKGIITYHASHEGRGFGLAAKLESYNLMDRGVRSSDAYIRMGLGSEDRRDFRAAVTILRYFGVKEVVMLGNNKKKADALKNAGIRVSERCSLIYDGNLEEVKTYLKVKANDPEQDLLRAVL
ncbi:hypothetical protein [Cohnella algarum]|uniref:hypothetical protein n=1 Tax=Cohnella algarum TaxID=2044859 RepID=UPI0019675900|nr:hypothetical protein [Cohnella algarum]MBN2982512.1 hypothetical protein [Cohnella algarum]